MSSRKFAITTKYAGADPDGAKAHDGEQPLGPAPTQAASQDSAQQAARQKAAEDNQDHQDADRPCQTLVRHAETP